MSSPLDANNPLRRLQTAEDEAGEQAKQRKQRNPLLGRLLGGEKREDEERRNVPSSAGTSAGTAGKVQLAAGYSQMDWMRKTKREGASLTGVEREKRANANRNVTLEEIAKHDVVGDCWVAFRGKAYNLTPYVEYHPGGSKILEQAFGKDCTHLFDKYHRYVNGEYVLRKCQIGVLPGFRPNLEDVDEEDE